MSVLPDIGVRVEGPAVADGFTQNVLPVLHELRHALELLHSTGKSTIIDLAAMPFGPGDEARLRQTLGTGEVTASVNTIGVTQIQETSFAGVWLVEYRSAEDARLALHIEVADVPFLVRTPREDLEVARRRLATRLSELATGDDQSHPAIAPSISELAWQTHSP